MAEPLNTGLSAQQVLTAFNRALNDYTDTEIDTLLSAKQDALTFDSAPTEDSTNPVTSGGVKTALAAKQDSIADLADIRSGAAAGATAVQPAEFEADQQRQDAIEAEDRAALVSLVDAGAKNIANFTFGGVIQNENVKPGTIVCTESNGVFDFSGTSDNKNYAAYILKQIRLKAGKYIISGVSGGSNMTYWMRFGSGTTDTFLFNLYDGTREVNITSDMILTVQFVIYANQTVSNIIVSPMICTAEDYAISPAFVPYAPTNRELYETCETKVTMQQVYGDAILIPGGSDLNSYTTPGTYYAVVADTSTIANTPYTATGFRLTVEKNTPSGAAVFQTIYPTSRSHLEFYRRVYEGGSWSSWYKFEGTVVS